MYHMQSFIVLDERALLCPSKTAAPVVKLLPPPSSAPPVRLSSSDLMKPVLALLWGQRVRREVLITPLL